MSDSIPEDLVAKMMVKCARRCCICRRFRPTKLQVHHIVERNQGGGNDEDNLIVTCMSCHTDVHSKVPFARRFSVEELKGHRDALVRMVEQGVLPADDTDDTDIVMRAIHQPATVEPRAETGLSAEAVEILLQAVNTKGPQQGSILVLRHSHGLSVQAGGASRLIGHDDRRTHAKYEQAVDQLVSCGLVKQRSATVMNVTNAGYLAADEIMVSRGEI